MKILSLIGDQTAAAVDELFVCALPVITVD